MRIIGGKWKGHHLSSFKADHIRPTTDRVKESLFNILQSEITEARVLDLFCGTGNLGLEALSRGAAHVVFIEKHPTSLAITRENIEKLKVPQEQFILMKSDVMKALHAYQQEPFDLIFADPPFTEKIAHEVVQACGQSSVFGDRTLLCIESSSRERIDEEYDTLRRVDHRIFGDKILSFFRKK